MQTESETILIGDIHGQAATLAALLARLGWKQRAGRLRGPGGVQLVFVGDLIDRGPENRRSVDLVRELVEQGDALCLMGNHEYNAVQFHTPDPDNPGRHLREQSAKNERQHAETLNEFKNDPAGEREMLAWFRTLPVALEGSGWRCVHACWDDAMLDRLERRDGAWYLAPDRWVAATREHQPEYRAIDILTKGHEFTLPGGATFTDKDGIVRREARVKWWLPAPRTLGEALLFQRMPEDLDLELPYRNPDHPGYPEHAPPVLFGHYWNHGPIRPERPNAACLDYSVAKPGGKLVAYRRGTEPAIEPDRFIVQPVITK